MLTPIRVRGNAADEVYEVVYRELQQGMRVLRDERVGPGVTASIAANGEILGIEVVGLQQNSVDAARRYADAHDLAFPSDLAAALPQRAKKTPRGSG
jgi:uncharacterized protein YuzE